MPKKKARLSESCECENFCEIKQKDFFRFKYITVTNRSFTKMFEESFLAYFQPRSVFKFLSVFDKK